MAHALTLASQRASGRLRSLPSLLEHESVLGPVLVSGAVLYMLALVGYPFLLALYLSVSDANVATSGLGNFVGLDNFVALFESSVFLTALRNTLLFVGIAAVFKSLLGTSLAFLLAENLPGTRVFRLIILLPWTIPIALSAITWKWMFDSQYSIINWIGTHLGIIHGNPIWLGDPVPGGHRDHRRECLARVPVRSDHLARRVDLGAAGHLDAAKVDGANGLVRFRKVIVPMIAPILFIGGLFDLVFSLTDLTVVNLLTVGGPANTTHVLASYAFLVSYSRAPLGVAQRSRCCCCLFFW